MVRKEWNPRSGGTGFGSLGAQVGVGIVTGVGHRNAPKGKGVKGHRRTRSTPASLGKGQGSAGLGRWRRGSGGAEIGRAHV